jgi:hypothetical protein
MLWVIIGSAFFLLIEGFNLFNIPIKLFIVLCAVVVVLSCISQIYVSLKYRKDSEEI